MKMENIHHPVNPASSSFDHLLRAQLQTKIDAGAGGNPLRDFQDEIDQMLVISASPKLLLAKLSELFRDRLDELAEGKEQVEVFCLQPYSPEIHHDEYLSGDANNELRSSDRASRRKALQSKTTTFMERLVKDSLNNRPFPRRLS